MSGPVAIATSASITTGVFFVAMTVVLDVVGYSEHPGVQVFALDWRVGVHLLGTALASFVVPFWRGLADWRARRRGEHDVVFLDSRGYHDEPKRERRLTNDATLAHIRQQTFDRDVAWGVAIGVSLVPIGIHRLMLPFHTSIRPHPWELQIYFAAAWLIVNIHLALALRQKRVA